MACKHGMSEAFCSLCNPPKQPAKRIPQQTRTTTVYGQSSITSRDIPNLGYVLIHTNKGRDHFSFGSLDRGTTMVHIDGHPFLWAIEKILDLAPNLKSIRVIPTMHRKMLESHQELCRSKGVSIITGHHRPDMAWAGENRSPFYQKQSLFLKGLQGEQKQLFDELKLLNFEELEMTARYFCLNGEEYEPQRLIANQFGFGEDEREVSERVNAVLHYLDPSLEVSEMSKIKTRIMKQRVERLRVGLKQTHNIFSLRQNLADKLGLVKLPEGLPLSKLETFEGLIICSRNGKLGWLKTYHGRLYKVIAMRYGLDDDVYRTLEEVGQSEGVTRERIRQLEEKTLVLLGIEDEPSSSNTPTESPVQ